MSDQGDAPPASHVPESEASAPAGLREGAYGVGRAADDAAAGLLINLSKQILGDLLATLTVANAPRVLSQVGKLALAQRKALTLFGHAPLPEELEGMSVAERRGALLGQDRESAGAQAVERLVATWRRGQLPGELQQTLTAAGLLDERVKALRHKLAAGRDEGKLASWQLEAEEAEERAAALREHAKRLGATLLGIEPPVGSAALGADLARVLTGGSPDELEDAMHAAPQLTAGLAQASGAGAWSRSVEDAMGGSEP